jgi:hypothetical protein
MDGLAIFPKSDLLTARRLDRSDFDAILDLNAGQDDVMRHAKPAGYDSSFRASLDDYLAGTDRCALFGSFRGTRLDACVSVYLWSTFPYYSTGNLKIRRGSTNPFSRLATPLSLCVQAVLQYTEAHGHLRGYMIRAADRWPVDRVVRALEHSVPELRRYHREIEMRVPRGTRPPFAFAWALMGKRTWDRDIVVEAVTLSQAGRSDR